MLTLSWVNSLLLHIWLHQSSQVTTPFVCTCPSKVAQTQECASPFVSDKKPRPWPHGRPLHSCPVYNAAEALDAQRETQLKGLGQATMNSCYGASRFGVWNQLLQSQHQAWRGKQTLSTRFPFNLLQVYIAGYLWEKIRHFYPFHNMWHLFAKSN